MASESSLEKWLRKEVKRRGGRCIKLTFLDGIPDRLILMPRGRCAFVELKTPEGNGEVSEIQDWWLAQLASMGFIALYSEDKQELVELLNQLESAK